MSDDCFVDARNHFDDSSPLIVPLQGAKKLIEPLRIRPLGSCSSNSTRSLFPPFDRASRSSDGGTFYTCASEHSLAGAKLQKKPSLAPSLHDPQLDDIHAFRRAHSRPPCVLHELESSIWKETIYEVVWFSLGLTLMFPLIALSLLLILLSLPLRAAKRLLSSEYTAPLLEAAKHWDPFWFFVPPTPITTSSPSNDIHIATITTATLPDLTDVRSHIRTRIVKHHPALSNHHSPGFDLIDHVTMAPSARAEHVTRLRPMDNWRVTLQQHTQGQTQQQQPCVVQVQDEQQSAVEGCNRDVPQQQPQDVPTIYVQDMMKHSRQQSTVTVELAAHVVDACVSMPRFVALLLDARHRFLYVPSLSDTQHEEQKPWLIAQAFSIGLLDLLRLCLRPRPHPVPAYFRPTLCTNDTGIRHTIDLPYMHQLTAALPMLHCSMEDLMLSLLAGALRSCLRSASIPHPPDLQASLVLDRNQRLNCPTNALSVVPLLLPCSVEGIIPRVWLCRKHLEATLDSSLIYALPFLSTVLEHTSLPRRVVKRLLRTPHGRSVCTVKFLQHVNLHLPAPSLHPLFDAPAVALYDPVPEHMLLSVVFVQSSPYDLRLCVQVNAGSACTFPASAFTTAFHAQLLALQTHISSKMVTVMQAACGRTPVHVPTVELPIQLEESVASNLLADESLCNNLGVKDAKLLEVEQLLQNVNEELTRIRLNPSLHTRVRLQRLGQFERQIVELQADLRTRISERSSTEELPAEPSSPLDDPPPPSPAVSVPAFPPPSPAPALSRTVSEDERSHSSSTLSVPMVAMNQPRSRKPSGSSLKRNKLRSRLQLMP